MRVAAPCMRVRLVDAVLPPPPPPSLSLSIYIQL